MKYQKSARKFTNAIRELASKPENLDNLERYLEYHFAGWLKEATSTPQDIADELQAFADMKF